jgi:hypothetical protein
MTTSQSGNNKGVPNRLYSSTSCTCNAEILATDDSLSYKTAYWQGS